MEEQSTNDCGSEFHIGTILTAKTLLRQDAWHRGILSFNVCPLVLVLGSIIKKSSNLRSINDLTILKHRIMSVRSRLSSKEIRPHAISR